MIALLATLLLTNHGGRLHGPTNAEIASIFSIQEDTVKKHVNAVFERIGAANRAEAVAIALRKHLLKI